ncbi:helix-turn-helix domain-containing protein [Rhodomicrobium udaipurense]|uniref:Helix-turn-helix domain-containing protein n=1 Tax=Rhodomicrobium udaipurense TaxID=1202716 RepID=A0A8I1GD84_9HYPH|nr:helix-turn-helix domain-containing protein [Rhodomicrobium udaipurense]
MRTYQELHAEYTTGEAAHYLGISRGHLEHMRPRGFGPVYSRRGRRCFYRVADLDAWAAQRRGAPRQSK